MNLIELFRRRKKAYWNIYNPCDVQEFAECSNCGYEIVPNLADSPDIPYPDVCPNCKARMR